MRVLLFALLAAISYAQTDEFSVGMLPPFGNALNLPIMPATHRLRADQIHATWASNSPFPAARALCINHETMMLPSQMGIPRPMKMIFLAELDWGLVYGAVLKVQTIQAERDEEIVLLKVFPTFSDAVTNEFIINQLLSRNIAGQVLAERLGGTIVRFDLNGMQFNGFAMQYLPHHNLFEYLQSEVQGMDAIERLSSLLSPRIKHIYDKCIVAMMKIWSLGVIHNDLTVMNVLYDPKYDHITIINFHNAKIIYSANPNGDEELVYHFGIASDFLKFSLWFASAILNPEYFFSAETPSRQIVDQNYGGMYKLSPDVSTFLRGEIPDSDSWNMVYDSFRRYQGADIPERLRNREALTPDQLQARLRERVWRRASGSVQVVNPDGSLNLGFLDRSPNTSPESPAPRYSTTRFQPGAPGPSNLLASAVQDIGAEYIDPQNRYPPMQAFRRIRQDMDSSDEASDEQIDAGSESESELFYSSDSSDPEIYLAQIINPDDTFWCISYIFFTMFVFILVWRFRKATKNSPRQDKNVYCDLMQQSQASVACSEYEDYLMENDEI